MARKPAQHRDEALIAQARRVLDEMNELSLSLRYAALLTDDGFEIVHLAGIRTSDGRFASMASSIQALSEAVARELSIGKSGYVIIAADDGYVIQQRVPGQTIVLGALFGNEETLGKALSISRLSAEKMATQATIASQ
jgi:predicted regulator of Ras-like GTPase activity (Roadblock/LC7/MglB family)